MNLIRKLLRAHISKGQLIGFFLANLTGVSIILLAIQLYVDISPVFEGGDSFLKKDYLITTKQVGALNMLSAESTVFSREEIKELEQQVFVKSIGEFISSAFHVTAGIEMRGNGFSTEMFFESVPDRFLDIPLTDWYFDEEERSIPIILPRNYLNLYNFGFAKSRNMPQISEGVAGMVRLNITLSGNGLKEKFNGYIAGFSNRLNTIIVPEDFMLWANKRYAPRKELRTSRLIIETANPSDKHVLNFFKEKGYEVEGGRLDSGRTLWFLNVMLSVVIGIGGVISLLSIYILILSIYLLLQKNSYKLESLLLLGYSVKQVSKPYEYLIIALNGGVFLIALSSVFIFRYCYAGWLKNIWPEFNTGNISIVILAAGVLFFVVVLLNMLAIQKRIKSLTKL